MNFSDHLKQKLTASLDATSVEIVDESWRHKGHAGNTNPFPDGTHLQIAIVSEQFRDLSLLDRHRLVHSVLKEEMATRIHALTLNTQTP